MTRAVHELHGGESASTNAAAREGTFAHAVAAHILNGGKIDIDEPFKFEDHGQMLKWPIPTDMLEHIEVYVDRIRRHAAGNILLIEHHVNLNFVRDDMYGTLDAAILKPGILVINDFKYGYVPVRIIDYNLLLDSEHGELSHINPQLLYYAAGLAHEHGWKHNEVILEITQPRCIEVPPVQSTTVSAIALKDWAENDLWEAAHLATLENAPLVAGEWCRFCPAMAICPEAKKVIQEQAETDFMEVASAILEVPSDDEKLSKILHWAPHIDAWIRACNELALSRMQNGHKIEGYKIVETRKHRIWPTEDPDTLAKLLKVPKKKLFADPEILSPSKMEKVATKKVVAAIAIRPAGDLTIAVESDRRPAVSLKGDFDGL